ncbi:MAG TPA: DUF2203 domain-containing protein [Verrucomicrobiota bacterium]|nr:DUF2203 domain-containing protein [Verrucomicrobiota bacterium]HNU51001.1 DUF2203 domain-containing protein [Verrucomicrobiota bacterium]
MSCRYTRHYTREEARELLPRVRRWLQRIRELRPLQDRLDAEAARMFARGRDMGGAGADRWARQAVELQGIADELREHQILVRDSERGRVDFPSLLCGREVFLCWQEGEDDVEYWHELDAGGGERHPV